MDGDRDICPCCHRFALCQPPESLLPRHRSSSRLPVPRASQFDSPPISLISVYAFRGPSTRLEIIPRTCTAPIDSRSVNPDLHYRFVLAVNRLVVASSPPTVIDVFTSSASIESIATGRLFTIAYAIDVFCSVVSDSFKYVPRACRLVDKPAFRR